MGEKNTIKKEPSTITPANKPNKSIFNSPSKITLIAAFFGILLLITALTTVIFVALKNPNYPKQLETYVISTNRQVLEDLFSFINVNMTSLNENDFSDFDDQSVAVAETESEISSTLQDMDELLEELDSIDEEFADFDDSEIY